MIIKAGLISSLLAAFSLYACAKDVRKDQQQKAESHQASGMRGLVPDQITFRKTRISINKVNLEIEVAETQEQLSHGLMYRKSMPDNHGMLFIFPTEQQLSFWMKNTYIPLSIGFFNEKKVLLNIENMTPDSPGRQLETYQSAGAAKYALEVNLGWFEKNKIKVGDRLQF